MAVDQVVVSVSHQGTRTPAHTVKGGQASWELAAGKLFVVGCDRQGLGMSLELLGVFPTQRPLIRNGTRESQPLHRHVGKEVRFNTAHIYRLSCPAVPCTVIEWMPRVLLF